MYKLLIIGLFFLIPGVFADTNGVWIDAKDVTAGTFGTDEGSGDYDFPNNLDVGGDFNAPSIETSDLVSSNVEITGNEGSLKMIGEDHNYIEFYPQGESAGRQSWLGYGTSGSDDLTMQVDGSSNVLLNPNGGYVGIGTDSPNSALDVSGDVNANNLFSNGEEVATNNYVDSEISDTRNYVDSEITNTRNYIDSEISSTRDWVNNQNYATNDYVNSQITNTRNYVDSEISDTRSWVNNQNYVDQTTLNNEVSNLENQINNQNFETEEIEVITGTSRECVSYYGTGSCGMYETTYTTETITVIK